MHFGECLLRDAVDLFGDFGFVESDAGDGHGELWAVGRKVFVIELCEVLKL